MSTYLPYRTLPSTIILQNPEAGDEDEDEVRPTTKKGKRKAPARGKNRAAEDNEEVVDLTEDEDEEEEEDEVRPTTKKGKRKPPARGKKQAAEDNEEVVDLTEDEDEEEDEVRPTTKKGKRKAPARGNTRKSTTEKGPYTTNAAKGKAPLSANGRGAKNSKRVLVQVLVEEDEEEVQITPPSSPHKEGERVVNDAEAFLARKGVSTARPNRPLIPPLPVAKPPASAKNPFNGSDSDSDSENEEPLSGRTRMAKEKRDQEKMAKMFPNWPIESEEPKRTVQVQVESDSDLEYDRIVKERESKTTGTKKNSGGNSSGSGSEWEKDTFEKLLQSKRSSKFSNTSNIVLVSPIPSPLKGGLRPLQNDSGVTLLRTRAKTAQFALSKEGAGTGTSSGSGVKSPNDGELSMERGAGANEGKFLFWNLWYPVLVP